MKKIGKWIVMLFMIVCCIFGLIACNVEEDEPAQNSKWVGTYKLVYCNHEFVLEVGVDGITEDYYVLRIHENETFYWFQMDFQYAKIGTWEEIGDKLYLDLDYNGMGVLEKTEGLFRFAGVDDEAEVGLFLNKEENIVCDRENIIGDYKLKYRIWEGGYLENGIITEKHIEIEKFGNNFVYGITKLNDDGTGSCYVDDGGMEYRSLDGIWENDANQIMLTKATDLIETQTTMTFAWYNNSLIFQSDWMTRDDTRARFTNVYVKVSESA